MRILDAVSAGPTLDYALRHGHLHLAEVVSGAAARGELRADALAALRAWAAFFLEPRPGMGTTAFEDLERDAERSALDEPEPETAQMPQRGSLASNWSK